MDPETKSFVIEQWAEYGAITLIHWSRLAVRIRVQGVRRLDGDDYLSILAFVRYRFSHIDTAPNPNNSTASE